ncbi:MAG: response regulator [Kofleriaceae bacterium]
MTQPTRRILLVEDSENDVALTMAAFEEVNLANEVVHACDGQEALDYIYRTGKYATRPEGHPVVVLLDLKLPRVDGLQVLAKLKADPALRTIPVVMLTSSREESDLARSYGLGVNAYVVKPLEFVEFVSALKKLGLFWAVVNQPPVGSAGRHGV